jgi:hypothetical protein
MRAIIHRIFGVEGFREVYLVMDIELCSVGLPVGSKAIDDRATGVPVS